MRLPIKRPYFDAIEAGAKNFEFRDAHITFVCEETGRTLCRAVKHVTFYPRETTEMIMRLPQAEMSALFTDKMQMCFILEKPASIVQREIETVAAKISGPPKVEPPSDRTVEVWKKAIEEANKETNEPAKRGPGGRFLKKQE